MKSKRAVSKYCGGNVAVVKKKLKITGANYASFGPDYMANFSPGWNFVAITWRTSARAEMLVSAPNMKLRAKSLGRIRQPYYFLLFSRAEISFRLHEIFSARSANQPGLKILARFGQTGLGFSARAELHPGLKKSPCNRQFDHVDFKRICFRSRAEILHVISQAFRSSWNR